MKLFVCWGTARFAPRPGGHPCGRGHHALKDAGHDPEVVRAYGWTLLPAALNRTSGRREVKELTGKSTVPVLVTDAGEVVTESRETEAWAKSNPVRPGP